MHSVFGFISWVAVWVVLVPATLLRIVVGKTTIDELRQRLGFIDPARIEAETRIHLHAVSVGELSAAEPLITLLQERHPGTAITISTGNRDGLARAGMIRGSSDSVREILFLPWDHRPIIRRWLVSLKPQIMVVLETEIWPTLFLTCRDLGIPVVIVNGRIYERDVNRYRLFRRFFTGVLSCVNRIGVQNQAEYERFISIGAEQGMVEIAGDLKSDLSATENEPGDGRLLDLAKLPGRLLVAGSTHDPEEEWITEAFLSLRGAVNDLRLIIAPRHVRRSPSVIQMIRARGLLVESWKSARILGNQWDVLVVDDIGWLPSLYRYASAAIVGGSFVRHGGHNIMEAAIHGCPIITGPYTFNFAETIESFRTRKAIVLAENREELGTALSTLLLDAAMAESVGQRGKEVAESSRGAVERYYEIIRETAAESLHEVVH